MGAEVLDTDLFGRTLDDRPDRPVPQRRLADLSGFRDRSEERPILNVRSLRPANDALFDPERE